ncbi:MAG: Uma2 family endonuclease [Planctomycetota bacterium]
MLDLEQLAPETLRPISRREFDRMVAMGLFDEDERIELLHGLLVQMSPIGPKHNYVVRRLTEGLVLALHGRATVSPQCSFAASDDSEPLPDMAVLPLGDSKTEHPTQALLVIEVADSSLRKDRTIKRELYAAAQVLEYWVVNLQDDLIEVFREPRDGQYTSVRSEGLGSSIALAAFPDVVVQVSDLLG